MADALLGLTGLLFLAALLLLEATYRGEKPRCFRLAIDHWVVLAKTRAISFCL